MSRQSAALSSATQHAMPLEFGRKLGTECLNTRFPLLTLLCAGYSVKLIQKIFIVLLQQGRQTQPSANTLRSPLSAKFWRHCILGGGTQRRALSRLELESNPQPVAFSYTLVPPRYNWDGMELYDFYCRCVYVLFLNDNWIPNNSSYLRYII